MYVCIDIYFNDSLDLLKKKMIIFAKGFVDSLF